MNHFIGTLNLMGGIPNKMGGDEESVEGGEIQC